MKTVTCDSPIPGGGATAAPSQAECVRERLIADVRRDLMRPQKQLQSRYLYDALGSRIFDAICELPEYQITRAERRLLDAHATEMCDGLASPITVVELGSGSGEKLVQLLEPLVRRGRQLRVELVDVSATALAQSRRALARFHDVPVSGHETMYETGLRLVAQARSGEGAMLVVFLGSNLGNFEPLAAQSFLATVRACLREGDSCLLGTELRKPERELRLAYDDPLGVTAAFNKNLLGRLNRELGANFNLAQFVHRVVWNGEASRIEMHLESVVEQTVSIPAAELEVQFTRGESIWTESSYKYDPDGVRDLGCRAGFDGCQQWVDANAGFAVSAFGAV